MLPVLLKTDAPRFLIIGGDAAGLQKAQELLRQNRDIRLRVVARSFSPAFSSLLSGYPQVALLEREYDSNDLKNTDFVIVAANDTALEHEVKQQASHHNVWVHLVHRPELSDFHLDVKPAKKQDNEKKYSKLAFRIAAVFLAVFFGYSLSAIITVDQLGLYASQIPAPFYIMLAVGFFAQLVDGAVGLGYGVTCSTSMMLFGVNLASISGSIHTAEMFSSAVSGYSHYRFGNVNKKLFLWLVIPGVIGAVAGSFLLIFLGDKYENVTYAIVSTYTFIIGIRLIIIAFRKNIEKKPVKTTGILGFAGGFFDAFGGGGWGPIVTSTLLAKGRKSKYVVGTVSLAEFFITLTASLVFFSSLGVKYVYIVAGLIIGGMMAAPMAARLAGKLPQKAAILAVAALVMISSLRVFLRFL